MRCQCRGGRALPSGRGAQPQPGGGEMPGGAAVSFAHCIHAPPELALLAPLHPFHTQFNNISTLSGTAASVAGCPSAQGSPACHMFRATRRVGTMHTPAGGRRAGAGAGAAHIAPITSCDAVTPGTGGTACKRSQCACRRPPHRALQRSIGSQRILLASEVHKPLQSQGIRSNGRWNGGSCTRSGRAQRQLALATMHA